MADDGNGKLMLGELRGELGGLKDRLTSLEAAIRGSFGKLDALRGDFAASARSQGERLGALESDRARIAGALKLLAVVWGLAQALLVLGLGAWIRWAVSG